MEPKVYADMEVKVVGCISATATKHVELVFTTMDERTVVIPTEAGTYYVPFTICDEYDTAVECVIRSSSWQIISEVKKVLDDHLLSKKRIAQFTGESFGNADSGYTFAVSSIVPEKYSV